jgi:hypothetical protein
MPMDYKTLHEAIQEDVECQIPQLPQQQFGAAGAGARVGGLNVMAILPSLIKYGLDVAVDSLGTTVEMLATAERDLIRSVVSDKALKFLEGLAHNLKSSP